jgi:hypothetical protein
MTSLTLERHSYWNESALLRDDFYGHLRWSDARWFGQALRAAGERRLAGDTVIDEGYRFSWFLPDRRFVMARISSYPLGCFGLSWIGEGWPLDPLELTAPTRLPLAELSRVRGRVSASFEEGARSRANGRWLLESWRGGAYRAAVDWGAERSALPAGGVALLEALNLRQRLL